IGIVIITIGSFTIGQALDSTEQYFPYNFVAFMLIGCLSTFAGMALIAALAPRSKVRLRLRRMWPFQEGTRTMWWMGLNHMGIGMVGPLFVIYHINKLGFSNTQVAYFIVATGIL